MHSQSPSLYTPVFPSLPYPIASSSPQSSSPAPRNPKKIISGLSQLHLSLASIPAELSPATFQESDAAARAHKLEIEVVYNDAQGQPSNGDWARLHKLADMTCTRSRFSISRPPLVHQDVDEDVPWILAETGEEWNEWETARKQGKLRKFLAKIAKDAESESENKDVKISSSKTKAIHEKVSSWKAQIEAQIDKSAAEAEKPAQNFDAEGLPTLGFLVSKPSAAVTRTKPRMPSKEPKPRFLKLSNSEPKPMEKEQHDSSDPSIPPATFSQVFTSTPRRSRIVKPSSITDSLPLFFASQISPERPRHPSPGLEIQTSPDHQPLFQPSQMPSSPNRQRPLFDPPSPENVQIQSPTATNKRKRPLTPPPEVDEAAGYMHPQVTFQTQAPLFKPPSKRPRTTVSVPSPPVSSSVNSKTPVKTSSPGPLSSPSKMAITPSRSVGKVLGNAKGIFGDAAVMSTPEKKPPTLTELLASSHRSKPRPRPPSRKNPASATPSKSKSSTSKSPFRQQPQMMMVDSSWGRDPDEKDKQGIEDDILDEDEPPPPPPTSPKTYFSSPASSSHSSASSCNLRKRFSPLGSPFFTQRPEAFQPQDTGTQIGEDRITAIGETSLTLESNTLDRSFGEERGLMRTGSRGIGVLGYNSQFDVDGNVDAVTAMLEKDVDVHQWYKEVQSQNQGFEDVVGSGI